MTINRKVHKLKSYAFATFNYTNIKRPPNHRTIKFVNM